MLSREADVQVDLRVREERLDNIRLLLIFESSHASADPVLPSLIWGHT